MNEKTEIRLKSLKNIIIDYLIFVYPEFVHKGQLDKMAINEWGYESETCGRKCRELENEGRIRKIFNEDRMVMYQYIPTDSNGNRKLL